MIGTKNRSFSISMFGRWILNNRGFQQHRTTTRSGTIENSTRCRGLSGRTWSYTTTIPLPVSWESRTRFKQPRKLKSHLSRQQNQTHGFTPSELTDVSVVIPCYNESESLAYLGQHSQERQTGVELLRIRSLFYFRQ